MIKIDIQKHINPKFDLDIQMDLEPGKITAIFGDSGAGKTSILNAICGIIKTNGSIKIEDKVWLDSHKKINLKPQKRSVSYVFQEDTLFPNMTILENLKYASGIDDQEILELSLSLFDLENLKDKKPQELSGGQKQRANICRGLMLNKKVLLLDEPIKGIEQEMRQRILNSIKARKKDGPYILFVTHQKSEVLSIADQVYMISEGKTVSKGSPDELFKLSDKFNFKLFGVVVEKGKDTILVETLNGILEVYTEEAFEIGSEVAVVEENTKLIVKQI